MASLKPVSSPLSVRWREFAQRSLPALTFILVTLGVIILWNQKLGRTSIVGQAEALHSNLTTLRAGTLTSLNVELLTQVKKGSVLAQITPTDLEAIRAKLTANVDLLKAQLAQSDERTVLSYQQFRLEWMRNNVELSTAKIDLQLAESNVERASSLFATSIVSEAEVQTRQARRDSLKDRVAALTRITAALEAEVTRLQPAVVLTEKPTDRAISAAILAQTAELQAIVDSSTLRAPIDGIVSAIHRRPGETVSAGEILIVLAPLQSTRIVAYLRQPLDSQIKPGDFAEVMTRNSSHRSAKARILSVGTQLEIIDPALLPAMFSNLHVVERGLPFLIEIPPTLQLAPAEIVNIRLLPSN